MTEISEKMKSIRDDVVNCNKCPLYKTRTLPVVGQGNHQAKILLIGEAPGANEDRTGQPFCGQAGQVLDRLLDSIGLKRPDVYVANILKCRPPGNRNPQTNEIEQCTPYLDRQIEIIKPKAIGAMGNFSSQYILKKFGLEEKIQGISKIHGHVFEAEDYTIIPLYHPAAATYNKNMEPVLIEGYKILKKYL